MIVAKQVSLPHPLRCELELAHFEPLQHLFASVVAASRPMPRELELEDLEVGWKVVFEGVGALVIWLGSWLL